MSFDGNVQAFFTATEQTMTCIDGNTGSTAVVLAAGSYTPTTYTAYVQTRLLAVMGTGWTCSLDTDTGQVYLRYSGTLTYSVTWTTTDARDVLGFTGNLSAVTQGVTSTSTNSAKGIWIPDAPLVSDSDLAQAPTVDDMRTVVGPTGVSVSLVGCDRYEHTGLVWSHVPIDRMWSNEASLVNQSYEEFYKDAIRGSGHSWFVPGSPLVITNHALVVAGSTLPVTSWKATDVPKLASVRMSEGRYTGLWRIEWPRIVSSS